MRERLRFVRFRLLCFGLVTSQTPVENNTESLCSQVVHIDVCLQQCDSSGTSESNSEFWWFSNFWGHTVLNMIAKATTGSKNKPCVNLEFCLFRYILRNLTLWPGNSVCWRWFLATFHAANIAFDFCAMAPFFTIRVQDGWSGQYGVVGNSVYMKLFMYFAQRSDIRPPIRHISNVQV